jgi:hypothetical protein
MHVLSHMRHSTWTTAADAPALPPPRAFFPALEKTADQSTDLPASPTAAVAVTAVDEEETAVVLNEEALRGAMTSPDAEDADGVCALALTFGVETSSLALAGSGDEAMKAVVVIMSSP